MKFKIPEDQLVFGEFFYLKFTIILVLKLSTSFFLTFLRIKQMITLSETCQISF